MPGRIKFIEETVYRIWDKWFKVFWNDTIKKSEENLLEALWDLWNIVYYRRKVLGRVTLFGKTAVIRRFERMVGKGGCAFEERNWTSNMEKKIQF